jgi:hypothetical protein
MEDKPDPDGERVSGSSRLSRGDLMLVRCRPFPAEPSPLLARVSGIPETIIRRFSSDICKTWLPTESALTQELAALRAELVERLHGLVRLASLEFRHFFLTVKRDAFNGRSLVRHRKDSRWAELARLAGPLADRAASLEGRLESWRHEFAAAYRRQREVEHQALLATLDDSGFLRGLALASPVLAEAAERARRSGGPGIANSRRESRLDLGLLRYVSRAALKLSPFSTLTRVALGKIEGETPEILTWAAEGWSERSLLRLRRYQSEELVELLRLHRPFREGLELRLNPTLEEISSERYRFLRPERWVPDVQTGGLRSVSASMVEINLPCLLVAGVFGEMSYGPRFYRDLSTAQSSEPGGAEAAELTLDALIEAGVLLQELPWPGNEPHLEKRLLSYLRTLPTDDRLRPVLEALASLVALEEDYSKAPKPVRSLAAIDRSLDELWRAAALLAGLASDAGRFRSPAGDVCEDVLLVSARTGQEVLRISKGAVQDIVRSVAPWARLTAFLGSRADFLLTLAVFLSRRWPDRREVSFLEAFGAAQPLWREYRKATAASGGRPVFNPLGLEKISALAELRSGIWNDLREILRGLPAGAPLPVATLESLAARIPEEYASTVGPCLFVQPADSSGNLWVLNRIFEGIGRYGSRFTFLMDGDTRRRYISRFVSASTLQVDGEPVDLLDLMWSRRDTLNVHTVQTARVLAIPGETLDRHEAEPVELRDLRVTLRAGPPRLTDSKGRRVLPVHLGGTACSLMPFVIQFLAQWGPGEILPLRSPVPTRAEGTLQVQERLTSGCLVLARRRWVASLGEDLRRQAAAASEEDAFAALNRWRMEKNLPERLFWIEKIHHAKVGEVYKPQYMNFSSPLFVEVFRSALRLNSDPLTFEEALPSPSDLPLGPGGERWAVELQLDTLPLGPDDLPEELVDESDAFMIPASPALGGRRL